MAMSKIKKGDAVIVLAGKSKGVEGKVLRVLTSKNRVLVEGANFVKKHVKPNPQANEQGGIIEREAPIDASNVAVALPLKKGESEKRYSRVGIKTLEDGKKVRYFKFNDELVDVV